MQVILLKDWIFFNLKQYFFQDQTLCTVSVFLLNLFSLLCFAFLFLEGATIATRLVSIGNCLWDKVWIAVLMGLAVPAAWTAAALAVGHEDMVPKEPRV